MNNAKYLFILRRLATILAVAVLTLTLTAAVTGILLAFYYEPIARGAYDSLQKITAEVPNGLLIRSVHNLAGNGLIVLSLIEIVVMFLGRQFKTSWLTAWISGILLTLTGIGLAWTSMILDWSQLGYWRLNIELGTIEAIPFIGSQLREIITGGGSITTATISRLYTLHSYLLSVGAVALAFIHLAGLLVQEKGQKEVKKELVEALSNLPEEESMQAP